jgi:hypothetical protein
MGHKNIANKRSQLIGRSAPKRCFETLGTQIMNSSNQIPEAVKTKLGYDPSISDDDLLKDWKQRISFVCKPCWELKYCPYGYLVEQFPLLPEDPTIPDIIRDSECKNFGHICPVIYAQESFTETSEERRRGRYIPFSVKIRVVHRDNYTCQKCGKHLKEDELEFDHIIPHSKGGSSEEHNIRLTCFKCNRSKSDHVEI